MKNEVIMQEFKQAQGAFANHTEETLRKEAIAGRREGLEVMRVYVSHVVRDIEAHSPSHHPHSTARHAPSKMQSKLIQNGCSMFSPKRTNGCSCVLWRHAAVRLCVHPSRRAPACIVQFFVPAHCEHGVRTCAWNVAERRATRRCRVSWNPVWRSSNRQARFGFT